MENNLLSSKIYFLDNTKEWVIFLHGIGGDSRTFSLQIKTFRPHFNLLLPDLRGHGASVNLTPPKGGKYSLQVIAEDVFRLMEHHGIEKAHFVGGSFGTTLIRIMQEMYPEKFISVIAAGGVLRLNTHIYAIFKLGKSLAPYINNHFLYKIMAYFIMPRKNHARSRQVFLYAAKQIDPKEYVAWLVILSEVKARLDNLFLLPFTSPVLFIMGQQDHAFLKDCKRFCDMNPKSEIEVISGCGHLTNIERYQDFNKRALKFIS